MGSQTIDVQTPAHQSMVEITRQIQFAIDRMDLNEGLVHVYCPHTTCGLLINENADPDVAADLLRRMERLVPWQDASDRHAEGNSAAHLRASLLGNIVSVPVSNRRLCLGTWQGIFMAEFDGPRTRQVRIDVMGFVRP